MACADLHLHDLTLGYDHHPVVHHLEGTIKRGERLALVGPNGGGKTTLLRTLAGEIQPLGGHVHGLASQGRVAYLPQLHGIDREFPIRVRDLVALGLWHRRGAWGGYTKQDWSQVDEALDAVALQPVAHQVIANLSGGQFQRALFARLMLEDAHLLLLDEPFAAVDAHTTTALMQIIERWQREQRTVVVVLHDLALVRQHFARTLLLAREMVAWGNTADVLTPTLLMQAQRRFLGPDPHADWCDLPAPTCSEERDQAAA